MCAVTRRVAIVLLSVVPALLGALPAGAETVLFIGNSFTYGELSPVRQFQPESVVDLNQEHTGGVPALVKAFAVQAHRDLEVSLETSPGKNLDFHLREKAALLDRPWDHVILQGYSTLDKLKPGDPTVLVESARRLAALFRARNPRVDIRLVSTWSRADETYLPSGHWYGKPIEEMALDVRAGYDRAAAASPVIRGVIPVGQAWNLAIARHLAMGNPYQPAAPAQIDLWGADHYHGSTYGYYLEALAIFGSVTGIDPRKLGPSEHAAAALGITPQVAVKLQEIAADTLGAEPAAH